MLPDLPSNEILKQLELALLIRRFEEELIKLAGGRDIGHFHVYIGQEMTGVPALHLLEKGDLSFTTHRNHGHLLARGVPAREMYAEILGKKTGMMGGRGGTLHLCSMQHGFPTTSSAVGGATPLATGAAFGFQKLGQDRVSVCLFGDGALEEGSWHESINIAAMEKLPVIFLCENNSLEALGQKAGEYPSSTLAATDLVDLVTPFGVPTIQIDGCDAGAVHTAMSEALRRARGGGGATFIEARTVRWPGNRPIWPELATGETNLTMAWDESLIPEEHKIWHAEQDAVLRFVREILATGLIEPQGILAMDETIRADMKAGVEFALESSYPEAESALELALA
ncbi:MAG: thiamine pyrophosphate-dependent dehydrogenase E1 component subunit alpha [Gammaproteobacteria bacterium]|nr:thiamine pyrophosphate-dependent dehydrogenase E1 component subunit alpha [Gammaproteobacteria bacterium]